MNVDDLARLRAEAESRLQRIQAEAEQQFMEPEIERQELAEYQQLSPEQHGVLYQVRGKKDYQEYVKEMERLKARWGNA